MAWFKRISLFILTNVLIMVTISIVWTLISHFFGLGAMNNQIALLAVFCLVMGMTGSFVSLFLSKWMAKTFYGVQVLNPRSASLPHEYQWLLSTVNTLAKKAQLPATPEVGIYSSPDVNAFATGPSKGNALVAVSSGLMEKMSKEEIEGVLGHEIAHIANGDMVTMTLIQGVVNSISLLISRLLANLVASVVEEKLQYAVRFAMIILGDILFTILGSMIVAYFSRRREFRADTGGARLASKPNMVAALRRLQSVYSLPLESHREDRDTMAALKISHREKPGLFMSLLMTHPPLEERIAALERAVR
jgi:heat shock protein HtpX